MRDVTKTKPSHHLPAAARGVAPAPPSVTTFEGGRLAGEIRASGHTEDMKARLIREIIEYEGTHGSCTQTFQRKIRKQLRPKA